MVVGIFSFSSCTSKPTSQFDTQNDPYLKPTIESSLTYKSLKILNLEQMTELLLEKAQDYRTNNRIASLKEGYQLALSRPNEDGLLDKVLNIVKTPLEDASEWEDTVQQLVSQNLKKLLDDNEASVHQVTSYIILENLISELKPQFVKQYKTSGFETQIIEKIAQAQVALSPKATQELKLILMRSGQSPSQLAERLVQQKNEKLQKEKEELERKK